MIKYGSKIIFGGTLYLIWIHPRNKHRMVRDKHAKTDSQYNTYQHLSVFFYNKFSDDSFVLNKGSTLF